MIKLQAAPRVKDFVKFEKKKLLLPAIFLLLFAILMYAFQLTGALQDTHACLVLDKLDAVKGTEQANLTGKEALAASVAAQAAVTKQLQLAYNDSIRFLVYQPAFQAAALVLKPIDPLLPYPCEFYPKERYCSYYLAKPAFDCIAAMASVEQPKTRALLAGLFGVADRAYTPLPLPLVLANAVWLFALGYLAASLIMAGYNKIKKLAQSLS
ncbi:MAG: hypothetical protein HY519_02480 [Candidatus Aenigmarchaeota archaeon]|nr:hypothetical protein [Candidatus Aenigmarchaeota archaeon]